VFLWHGRTRRGEILKNKTTQQQTKLLGRNDDYYKSNHTHGVGFWIGLIVRISIIRRRNSFSFAPIPDRFLSTGALWILNQHVVVVILVVQFLKWRLWSRIGKQKGAPRHSFFWSSNGSRNPMGTGFATRRLAKGRFWSFLIR
jgi:hypothetical protein